MAIQKPVQTEQDPASILTRTLAASSASLKYEALPSDIVELARQCLLDWLAVTIAGAREPAVTILIAEVTEQGANPQASLIGHATKLSMQQAALVNGTASHALDYDDVNWSLEGHPSAAIVPGLLALAEARGASGSEFITAFTAGYESTCRIGRLVSPSHYKHGFHATATVGALGAAAACARLLGLDAETTATALGIAGTQAAGLKSMFGTMCKPLHAGKAAQNGLLAASLAARGFESRRDVLECAQGFAATQSRDFNTDAALGDSVAGYYLRENLFKYHAACYLTHSTIECCHRLRDRFGITPETVRKVILRVDETLDGVCNIPEPKSGNEAKFSLRLMAAFALAGVDTSSIGSYSVSNCTDQALITLRDKVRVEFASGWPATKTEVSIEIGDSSKVEDSHDSGIPAVNLATQRNQLEAKFHSLVDPILGIEKSAKLMSCTNNLQQLPDLSELLKACQASS